MGPIQEAHGIAAPVLVADTQEGPNSLPLREVSDMRPKLDNTATGPIEDIKNMSSASNTLGPDPAITTPCAAVELQAQTTHVKSRTSAPSQLETSDPLFNNLGLENSPRHTFL